MQKATQHVYNHSSEVRDVYFYAVYYTSLKGNEQSCRHGGGRLGSQLTFAGQ